MKNKAELRRLTWKYFWKRKRQEVWDFIKKGAPLFAPIGVFVIMIMVLIFPDSLFTKIVAILLCIAMFIFIIFIIVYIIHKFIKWLRSNWKLASQDAVEELKRRSKKRLI